MLSNMFLTLLNCGGLHISCRKERNERVPCHVCQKNAITRLSTNHESGEDEVVSGQFKCFPYPYFSQAQFIQLCKTVYNMFRDHENESQLYQSISLVATLLLKMGEVGLRCIFIGYGCE